MVQAQAQEQAEEPELGVEQPVLGQGEEVVVQKGLLYLGL